MTSDQSVDKRIRSGILEVTADELPDRVLQATFEQTRTVRQRRGLSGWRLTKMIRINRSMFVVGAAAIVLLAIVGVALLPRLGSLMGSGEPTGQIAFERTVEGNTDIYLINLDGTGLVRLTDDPLPDHGSAWSPDGGTLFFSRQIRQDEASDIYSLDIESGNATQLTDDPGIESSPKVSPDGSQIAFDVWPSEPGIYVMNVDGSGQHTLIGGPTDDFGPAWSPDGQQLAFIRFDDRTVYVANADGTGEHVVRALGLQAVPAWQPRGDRRP